MRFAISVHVSFVIYVPCGTMVVSLYSTTTVRSIHLDKRLVDKSFRTHIYRLFGKTQITRPQPRSLWNTNGGGETRLLYAQVNHTGPFVIAFVVSSPYPWTPRNQVIYTALHVAAARMGVTAIPQSSPDLSATLGSTH